MLLALAGEEPAPPIGEAAAAAAAGAAGPAAVPSIFSLKAISRSAGTLAPFVCNWMAAASIVLPFLIAVAWASARPSPTTSEKSLLPTFWASATMVGNWPESLRMRPESCSENCAALVETAMIGNPLVTFPVTSAAAASVLEAMVTRSLIIPCVGDCLNSSAAAIETVSGLVVLTRLRNAAVVSSAALTGAPAAALSTEGACCGAAGGAVSTFCALATAEKRPMLAINIAPTSIEPLRMRGIQLSKSFKIRL